MAWRVDIRTLHNPHRQPQEEMGGANCALFDARVQLLAWYYPTHCCNTSEHFLNGPDGAFILDSFF